MKHISNPQTKTRRCGILFYYNDAGKIWILLGERRGSLAWDVPDGEQQMDTDPWVTAVNVYLEELCGMPDVYDKQFSISSPIRLFAPFRTVFVVELPERPGFGTFLSMDHYEGSPHFRRFGWEPISHLPWKAHWSLYPILWLLWYFHQSPTFPRKAARSKGTVNRRPKSSPWRSRVQRAINRVFVRF